MQFMSKPMRSKPTRGGAGASAESGDADDVALDCGTLVDGGGWLGGQWRARPAKKMKTNNMRLCGLDPFDAGRQSPGKRGARVPPPSAQILSKSTETGPVWNHPNWASGGQKGWIDGILKSWEDLDIYGDYGFEPKRSPNRIWKNPFMA